MTVTAAEKLALVREAEELRAQLYRGGLTPDHRKVIGARLTEITKVQIEAEEAAAAAARPPPRPTPDEVKALSPAQAAAKAQDLRKDKRYFGHLPSAVEERRSVEQLRARVELLDRRASEEE